MQKFPEKLKRAFGRTRRQRLTAAALLVIVNVIVAVGVFAYFNSSDTVTNRLMAEHGSVKLVEHDWDRIGQELAKRSEPGMSIDKDPQGYNDGSIPLYVRLKMVVTIPAVKERNLDPALIDIQEDGRVGVPVNMTRLKGIMQALMTEGKSFVTLDEDCWTPSGITGTKEVFSIVCNNANFVTDGKNYGTIPNEAKDAKELIYYFYYTGGSEDGTMAVVEPDGYTAELFDKVEIPKYKKDYYGVFDQKYYITLYAQGVPVASFSAAPKMDEFDAEADAK